MPVNSKIPASIFDPTVGWTDFSASLAITSQSSTDPTKGNSTYRAKYQAVGKIVNYAFQITIGSTFTAGSGAYRFNLPVVPSTGLGPNTGSAWVNDVSTARYVGICHLYSQFGFVEIWIANNTSTPIGSAGPGAAWATGDIIEAQLTYEGN